MGLDDPTVHALIIVSHEPPHLPTDLCMPAFQVRQYRPGNSVSCQLGTSGSREGVILKTIRPECAVLFLYFFFPTANAANGYFSEPQIFMMLLSRVSLLGRLVPQRTFSTLIRGEPVEALASQFKACGVAEQVRVFMSFSLHRNNIRFFLLIPFFPNNS